MRIFLLLFIFIQILVAPSLLSAMGVEYELSYTQITEEESNSQKSLSKEIMDVFIDLPSLDGISESEDVSVVYTSRYHSYEEEIHISLPNPPPEF